MNPHQVDLQSEQIAAEKLAGFGRRKAAQRRNFFARQPQRIDRVVAQLVQRKGYAQIRATGAREEAWQKALAELIKPEWVTSTQVGGLRRGVFEVMVADSLLMQELTFYKEELLAKLQQALPEEKIKQVRFKVKQFCKNESE